MVRLSPQQLEEFETRGYVIIDAPWTPQLTRDCVSAVVQGRKHGLNVEDLDTIGNHWRLAPVTKGSYWSHVDHSLPFMSILTHPEVVEIGQQRDFALHECKGGAELRAAEAFYLPDPGPHEPFSDWAVRTRKGRRPRQIRAVIPDVALV